MEVKKSVKIKKSVEVKKSVKIKKNVKVGSIKIKLIKVKVKRNN